MNLQLERALKEKKRLERKQKKLGDIFKRTEEINELNNSIALLVELSKEPINDICEKTLNSIINSEKIQKETRKTLLTEKKKINLAKLAVNFLLIFGGTFLFLKIIL